MNSISCVQGCESPLVVTNRNIIVGRNEANLKVDVEDRGSYAVHVRNLSKRYGNMHVLSKFSMEVRKGTIYGLLGASGCGKTTVLSTLVGLKKWDSGDVSVLGEPPGKVGKRLGYVPQDTGLYDQLSIQEVIRFYGRMFNMPDQELSERFTFLSKLLELPSQSRLIAELSGGEKRRASLAVALVHCPSLLVLDEPTVGLDPLLRRRVWNHLRKIVSTLNTTVIITTHYIEEVRHANTVGVMRRGRLLVQDSPTSLLHSFQSQLLEEVVLHLCRKDKNQPKTTTEMGNELKFTSNWKRDVSSTLGINFDELMDGIFRKRVGFDNDIHENLGSRDNISDNPSYFIKLRNSAAFQAIQRIRAFTTVLMLTFIRHPVFMGLILLMPTFHGTITCVTVGAKPKDMNFGIVNKELVNWSTTCGATTHSTNSCDFSALSCKFIYHLQERKIFKLTAFNDEESALKEVQRGRAWGYMVLEKNYSKQMLNLLVTKMFATAETIEGSRIRFRMDQSQYVSTFFVIKDLYSAFDDFIQTLVSSCGMNGEFVKLPLNFRQPVYGRYGDNYMDFAAPGIIVCVLTAILIVLTSVSFITDRKQGTLSRARVAGLRISDILIGYMIIQTMVTLIQTILWAVIPLLLVDYVIVGPIWLYVFILVEVSLCATVIGILMGIVFNTEVECFVFGFCCVPICIMFGGAFWPLEYASPFWKQLGHILPTTVPIMSLRSVITRGLGITHVLVWPGVAVSFAWITILLLLIYVTYQRLLNQ